MSNNVGAVDITTYAREAQQRGMKVIESRQVNNDRAVHTNPAIMNPAKAVWNLIDLKL